MSNTNVRLADWQQDAAIRHIRQTVFVEEQQVPPDLELDDKDAEAIHFLMFLEQQAIGTGRLLADGSIGRVAILAEHRRQGFGHVLMREIIQHAQKIGMTSLTLSAQTHALDFYQGLGFEPCSSVYPDAGIPHQDMIWTGEKGSD